MITINLFVNQIFNWFDFKSFFIWHCPYSIYNHNLIPLTPLKITIYLTKNYCNDIKANDIGDAVGLHPDYANHIFKKAFGTTISDYIAELRIAHAQRKLLTTDMSITDIAYECGFNSIARFNATFFKKIQCTPREYKKKIVK